MAGDELKPQATPKPTSVKVFNCPSCGAGVTLRAMGQSMTAVCGSCAAIIDSSNENYRILEQAEKKGRRTQVIPLGQRGRLRGALWEVIGYMERTDGGDVYCWSEYLLFNPQKGFRWLTEFDGHWNYVITTKEQPKIFTNDTRIRSTYLGKHYYLFHRGRAVVSYVLGEFYWQVKQGETVDVEDYVAPPEILSREKSHSESIWSLGEYVNADEIQSAFQITRPMPLQTGVAPNQLSTVADSASYAGRYWFLFMVAIFAIQFAAGFFTRDKTVYEGTFVFSSTDADRSKVTPPIVIDGRTTNLQVTFASPISNNWLEVKTDLVNDDNGETQEFEQGIEFYHGYDSDGSWSEGSPYSTVVLSSIPAGKYHLNIEASGPPLPVLNQVPPLAPEIAAQIVIRSEMWPNGKLKSAEPVIGSIREGVAKYYFEDGALEKEISYRNGLKSGPYTLYDSGGRPVERGNFQSDRLHGTITYFGSQGEVAREVFFKNGVQVSQLSDGEAPLSLQVTIKRDVITWSNFLWSLLLVSVFPIIVLWRRRSFEMSRWSQSDFSPYYSEED